VSTLHQAGDLVSPELRDKLHALLQNEVASVRDDFATSRPWYVNSPVSNQFVLPSVGVVRACIELGKRRGDADYEFGIANLLRALAAQGKDGAHHEGARYGSFTTREILMAARACAQNGDRRLIEHPHLQNFGFWLLHMMQPGNHLVNISDGIDRIVQLQNEEVPTVKLGSRQSPPGAAILDSLMLWEMATGEPTVRATLARLFPNLYPSALSAEYSTWLEKQPKAQVETAPFASFSSSPLVAWRSGWDDKADGVWVRGGSPQDSHDHRDRGHVNYIVNGKEALIEAGSTDYAEVMKTPEPYQGGLGHNVLQIGSTPAGAQRKGGNVPLTIKKLDAEGGDMTVSPTSEYDPKLLKNWTRHVTWNKAGLQVEDAVALSDGVLQPILFRWHLATDAAVDISFANDQKSVRVSWPDGVLTLQADAPLQVTTAQLPHGITYFSHATHTYLLVQSAQSAQEMKLTTTCKANQDPRN